VPLDVHHIKNALESVVSSGYTTTTHRMHRRSAPA